MPLPSKYTGIVNGAALAAGAIGVPGSVCPPLDMAATSAIWIKMTRDIAKASGHAVDGMFATKLIYSICAGSALYVCGSKVFNAILHLIPGAGTVTAAGANATLNYVYTNRLGAKLVAQFDRPTLNKVSLMIMATKIATAVFEPVWAPELARARHALHLD
jgi:uncharacterized protein (DUF697 family)